MRSPLTICKAQSWHSLLPPKTPQANYILPYLSQSAHLPPPGFTLRNFIGPGFFSRHLMSTLNRRVGLPIRSTLSEGESLALRLSSHCFMYAQRLNIMLPARK